MLGKSFVLMASFCASFLLTLHVVVAAKFSDAFLQQNNQAAVVNAYLSVPLTQLPHIPQDSKVQDIAELVAVRKACLDDPLNCHSHIAVDQALERYYTSYEFSTEFNEWLRQKKLTIIDLLIDYPALVSARQAWDLPIAVGGMTIEEKEAVLHTMVGYLVEQGVLDDVSLGFGTLPQFGAGVFHSKDQAITVNDRYSLHQMGFEEALRLVLHELNHAIVYEITQHGDTILDFKVLHLNTPEQGGYLGLGHHSINPNERVANDFQQIAYYIGLADDDVRAVSMRELSMRMQALTGL